jgi:hypothetical protein
MIPVNKKDPSQTMELLTSAIKSVYASVFFKESKAYIEATSNVIDEEKMGIVIQEVCGTRHGNHYYPTISGVARSINFYPIAPEKPEDGIVKVAFGLGKYIMDGGISLRFSPPYPKKILQLSSSKLMLRDTQKQFYALNLKEESYQVSTDDAVNLTRLKVTDIKNDQAFHHLCRDPATRNLPAGIHYQGSPGDWSAGDEPAHRDRVCGEHGCSQREPFYIQFLTDQTHSGNRPVLFYRHGSGSGRGDHPLFPIGPGQRRIYRD